MDAQTAIDLGRRAIVVALIIGSPVLVVGMAVGLLIGLFQALTQIQDQTIAFVPKIIAMIAALGLCLPWLIQFMSGYCRELITDIPSVMSGM